jgi:NAD(P)H-flavin reductase
VRSPESRRHEDEASSLGIGSLRGSTSTVSRDAFTALLGRGSATDGIASLAPTSARSVGAPGQVLAIDECGPTVRVFRIGRPAGLTFEPGQYVKLGAPGEKREDFSIASAPHDRHLELAIQLREGGTVTHALFALRVGDAVDISEGAKGKLRLESSAAHHLMVATVTGIAPLISMVRDAIHRGTGQDFTVVVGASYQHELPFHAELESLAAAEPHVTYVPTVSRPAEEPNRGWSGSTGRADVVARSIVDRFDPTTTHVYAVGNAGMIRNVERDFGRAGFRVSTESYGG